MLPIVIQTIPVAANTAGAVVIVVIVEVVADLVGAVATVMCGYVCCPL